MLNINTLDNVIAMIVVILLLSLIVQSLQSLIKKLLSIKSQQIEDSLLDLFDAVLRGQKQVLPKNMRTRVTAIMPRIFRASPEGTASNGAMKLLSAVKGEMQELGRVNNKGQFTVESLSKSDLLNVLARVGPDTLIDKFTPKLQKAMQAVKDIEKALADVQAAGLPGEANALFAKLREAIAPLQQHYRTLTTQGTVNAGVVVADVLSLRDVVFSDTLDLLAKIQKILAEQQPQDAAIKAAEESLANVAAAITAAREALDDAFGSFKAKLTEIEGWFDTAMQGFEERYNRGMKTWSIVLGALVVIVLNANVFSIYRNISKSDVLRKSLVDAGGPIVQLQEKIASDEKALSETPKESQPKLEKQIADEKQELDKLVDMYTGFGFQPLSIKRLKMWLAGAFTSIDQWWWVRRGNDFKTFAGWLVMTMLLSLGAPFWHDALQSLFGVKNLLQKKNEQRNVEQKLGAGNPTS
jgi:hypothetical protein